MQLRSALTGLTLCAVAVTAAIAGSDSGDTPSITPRAMADALHLVMDSDRAVYTKKIVNRLVKKDKVIKASEHFEDDQALALPAQMFRFGAEMVAERAENMPDVNFSYSLQSLWPVNKQNAPKTLVEPASISSAPRSPLWSSSRPVSILWPPAGQFSPAGSSVTDTRLASPSAPATPLHTVTVCSISSASSSASPSTSRPTSSL